MNKDVYNQYISRVNKVQDYINTNLNKELTLPELAAVAGFSEYHFHRIFSGIVNESLYKYINRQRLEKAANYLINYPEKSITDIAFDTGFSESSIFARSFKKTYGMNASSYRKNKTDISIKIPRLFDNQYDDINCSVDIVDIEEFDVAYLRYTGPYKNNQQTFINIIQQLRVWAEKRNLFNIENLKLFSIYHDNPEITENSKQRTTICIAIPKDTEVDDNIGKMLIASGTYAVGHFEILSEQFPAAWNYMFGKWMPSSGYQAADGFTFELYKNNPLDHPKRISYVDIFVPVKRF